MDKAQMIKESIKEIEHIKKHATTFELARLDIDFFDEDSQFHCIYGQMTGHCKSARAKELYHKSYDVVEGNFIKGIDFTMLEKLLFFTRKVTHEKIINYLQGVTDTITINEDEIDESEH